jgi:serine/threonine protein kinase
MPTIANRYEIKSKLGEGGMGVVFRAYDPKPLDREVAVKTLHEFSDPYARELFYKECSALKSISHPNIVEIFDMGEYDEGGHKRPFFVMPLLAGQTLDELIRKSSHRLTIDRVVEIFTQTCRGLQAAHERGLIHRDLKPSNIFVMADDSVKIIDFGVAHSTSERSRSGYGKGTLVYMAPEQVQHKPVSVQSDIYSLGVTLYEALTRRQPFRTSNEEGIIQAILGQIPPPATDLNPAVSHVISRVVHKAMAKRPWNRFDSAREFGETLQKAYRNDPIPLFDPARTQPRLQTAQRALDKGDFQFAGEIVSELEEEGSIDPQLRLLRAQIDQIARQKTVAQLLESASARFEEQEDPLALQKIQEVLHLDPTNVGALSLKSKIEGRRSERQMDKWLHLAQQHVENRSYAHAREALQHALELRPKDTRAIKLMKQVEREETDYVRLRREKTDMYQAAVNAWQNGEVSQALSQMRHVLDLDRRAPDDTSPDASNTYQSFYDRLRSEYDAMSAAYADAKRHLGDRQFAEALTICETFLKKYPGNALFQALKFDIEAQQRQSLSAYIAEVDRKLDAEPDLEAKLSLVREAAGEFPNDEHFRRLVKLYQDKRDLVASIVERAKVHENAGQITEALSDLETLATIYSAYPGLSFEKERLQRRLEQQTREAARARSVRQIDVQLQAGDFERATELLDDAEAEYPGDAELAELRKLAQQRADRTQRAQELVAEGQRLCSAGDFAQGVECLRSALRLDEGSGARIALRDALVDRAQEIFASSWREAEILVDQALDLDPHHPLARSLRAQALDRRRDETVPQAAQLARRLQAEGRFEEAMEEVDKVLKVYSNDSRLVVIADALKKEIERVHPTPPTVAPGEPAAASPEAANETRRSFETTHLPGETTRRSGDPAPETSIDPNSETPTGLPIPPTVASAPVPPVSTGTGTAPTGSGAAPTAAPTRGPIENAGGDVEETRRVALADAAAIAPSGRRGLWISAAAVLLLGTGVWALLLRPAGGSAATPSESASPTSSPQSSAPPASDSPTLPALPDSQSATVSAPPASPPQPTASPAAPAAPASGVANQPVTPVQPPPPSTPPPATTPSASAARAAVIPVSSPTSTPTPTPTPAPTPALTPTPTPTPTPAPTPAPSPPPAASGIVNGIVRVRTDADVRVTVTREDGSGAQTFQGPRELSLAPGTYRVNAQSTRDPIPMTTPATLRVEPGATREFEVPYVRGIYALQSTRWIEAGGDWIRLTQRDAMLDVPPAGGRIVFTARVNANYYRSGPFQSGGALTWVYGYQDAQNYFACSLTGTDIHIQRRANGTLTTLSQVPHQIVERPGVYDLVDGLEISIDFSGAAPVHRYRLLPKRGDPTEWKILPGEFPRASGGRFGFLASAPNALVIKRTFRFYPAIR